MSEIKENFFSEKRKKGVAEECLDITVSETVKEIREYIGEAKENFFNEQELTQGETGNEPEPERAQFSYENFVPAVDRILIRRLPDVKEDGLIARPDVAVEQSEMGRVIAIGADVEVPIGVVAKFSKYSAEDIHFDDEGDDKFVLVYKHDVRGWFNA